MDNFEMTEKLRQRANVSYEEAKAALEANEWDLLDALVYLENRRTAQKPADSSPREHPAQAEGSGYTTRRSVGAGAVAEDSERGFLGRLVGFIRDTVHKGNRTFFEIRFRGDMVVELPLTAMVPILFWAFKPTVIALLIGLFLGAKYRIRGQSEHSGVNRFMEKASRMAEDVRFGGGQKE